MVVIYEPQNRVRRVSTKEKGTVLSRERDDSQVHLPISYTVAWDRGSSPEPMVRAEEIEPSFDEATISSLTADEEEQFRRNIENSTGIAKQPSASRRVRCPQSPNGDHQWLHNWNFIDPVTHQPMCRWACRNCDEIAWTPMGSNP